MTLSEKTIESIFRKAEAPGYRMKVDLKTQEVSDAEGLSIPFEVDPFRRECLMGGLDDIGLTLQWEDRIRQYEERQGIPDRG